jgi:hypothetical protein
VTFFCYASVVTLIEAVAQPEFGIAFVPVEGSVGAKI